MKKYIFMVLVFCCTTATAQLSTKEPPFSFTAEYKALTDGLPMISIDRKSMDSLNMEIIEKEDYEDELSKVPPRFGYPHKVDYNLNNAGTWQKLPNGDRIWRLKIYCPDALSINLLYDKFWIPEGGKFFIYTSDKSKSIGAFTSKNNNGDKKDAKGFATGLLFGDEITLEYYQPKDLKENADISISYVIHGYRYFKLGGNGFGESGGCQIDINSPAGSNWQNEKRSVTMIVVDGYRMCTGSLMNTTAYDARPLLLTADHCLFSQGIRMYDATDPNYSSMPYWLFYWDYELPSYALNSSTEPSYFSTSGATVIANDSISDFALLQLTEDPADESGFVPYYMGWDRGGSAGTGGACIHHPSGDVKKISTYSTSPLSTFRNDTSYNAGGYFWKVVWEGNGCTEGGSSGSALLNNNHLVVGQLSGGNSNCFNQNGSDWYGKFSVSWTGNNSTIPKRRLRDWLDPINSGATIVYGTYKIPNLILTGSSYLCDTNTYSITNLPTGASVSWSLISGNTSCVSLQSNSPSTNQCTLTLTNSSGFNSVTLKADIIMNGVTVKSLQKVINKAVPFSGTYEQMGCSDYGFTTPAITPTTIPSNHTMTVYVGGIVTLTSNYFKLKDVTTSGPYGNFYYAGGNQIRFTLTPANVSQALVITIHEEGCDDEVQLTFYAYPIQNFNLSITPQDSKTYELSLTREKVGRSEQVDEPWTLDVTNAATGRKALTKEMDAPAFILQTEGWEPGVYVIRALVGEESLTGKITVN